MREQLKKIKKWQKQKMTINETIEGNGHNIQ